MTKHTTPEVDILVERADQAVRALETLGDGEAFAEPLAAAGGLVAELAELARGAIFTSALAPVDVGALLDFQEARDYLPRLSVAEATAELHREALAGGHTSLAVLLRGPRARRFLTAALVASSGTLNRPAEVALAEGLRRYERLVAAQLAGDAAHEPWATILGTTVPALQARLLAARAALESRAAAAVERLRQEQAEADRVLEVTRRERRAALAERLRRLPASRQFSVPIAQIGDVGEASALLLAGRIREGWYSDDFLAQLAHELDALEAAAGGVR